MPAMPPAPEPRSARYVDWWAGDEAATQHYVAHGAPIEEAGAAHMVRSYLVPLLERHGIRPGAAVLSVGCGTGADVQTLREAGYLAYGIETGSRIICWRRRTCREQLLIGDATAMPFQTGRFDFVFAEGVVEHIGSSGDVEDMEPDWRESRLAFASEVARVCRPGGYMLVTCPNRLFPYDAFHAPGWHSPFHPFLLSFGDIRRLFGESFAQIQSLTWGHFFNVKRLAPGGPVGALISLIDAAAAALPGGLFGLPLSPYLIVLMRRA